jgi:hypothetical protein
MTFALPRRNRAWSRKRERRGQLPSVSAPGESKLPSPGNTGFEVALGSGPAILNNLSRFWESEFRATLREAAQDRRMVLGVTQAYLDAPSRFGELPYARHGPEADTRLLNKQDPTAAAANLHGPDVCPVRTPGLVRHPKLGRDESLLRGLVPTQAGRDGQPVELPGLRQSVERFDTVSLS